MAESFFNLEDEPLPSFLSSCMDSRLSGPGFPVAASTVAKIRAGTDNKGNVEEVSYLEGGQRSSNGEKAKFCLSFEDDMDSADDFIAAHRFSDMLVKVHMDESQASMRGAQPSQSMTLQGRPTDLGSDLSTGLLTFAQYRPQDTTDTKSPRARPPPATGEEDDDDSSGAESDAVDSDHFSGSVSSFLANEKLMSVDSIVSNLTDDDDVDLNNLPDDELEQYFRTLVPPAMQRGRVEGQEIPAAGGLSGLPNRNSNASTAEQERIREQFLEDFDQDEFQMPDVRLAATGMDSYPASAEDTEDELEAARTGTFRTAASRTQRLLPSTSRQLVGESNRPSFRPGLEGGSSDDEPAGGRGGPPTSTGIEHRRSAEGQVINPPVTGDGGGGDGSSGSDEGGAGGTPAAAAAPPPGSTYDVLRGLGIVGGSGVDGEDLHHLPGFGRSGFSGPTEMGDRVGPVGTGEASSPPEAPAGAARLSPLNWSMSLDRRETLDAMHSTRAGPPAEALLDPQYLRTGPSPWRPQDPAGSAPPQGPQSSFRLSQVLPDWGVGGRDDDEEEEDGVDVPDGVRLSLGFRGGPCGGGTAAGDTESASEEEGHAALSTSLEAKYFSKSFQQEEEQEEGEEDSDDGWNHCPEDLEAEFQQGANAPDDVVYQNEEGKWVTDLAYFSSFEKEVDGNAPESAGPLQAEEFLPAGNAIEKIMEDQQQFEKEHQFMQEEQMEAACESPALGDTSWRLPASSHVLMRASQASSELERGNHSYLRLSLGQFFGQRSEALGCLGGGSGADDDTADGVKRPSFGYIITSPQKRDPFPLIRPSEFPSSRDGSVLGHTVVLGPEDRTLNAEDLDQTLEAPGDRMSPKGDRMSPKGDRISPKGDRMSPKGDPDPRLGEEKALYPPTPRSPPGSADQTCVTPGNASGSDLTLSISTITSAIADASLSADPSQLAAMIMELSRRRGKAKGRHGNAGTGGGADRTSPLQHVDHSVLLEALQRSTSSPEEAEAAAFDLEKYLLRAEASGLSESGDSSLGQTTFDLSRWTNAPGASSQGGPARGEETTPALTPSRSGPRGVTAEEDPPNPRRSSQPGTQRRSAIPRPKASPGRRSVTSGEPPAAKPAANGKTTATGGASSVVDGNRPQTTATVAPAGRVAEYRAGLGTVRSQANANANANANAATQAPSLGPQNHGMGPAQVQAQPGPQGTSPGLRTGRSGLPCPRGSSPPSQRGRDQGQPGGQPVTSSTAPEKRPQPPPPHEEQRAAPRCRSPPPPGQHHTFMTQSSCEPPAGGETSGHFRPSTCPLIHSSPSQTSFPSSDCTLSSPPTAADRRPDCERSPQSTCSSPGLSRLTYISINESNAAAGPAPTPDRKRNDRTISLSTTIVRASPTPPLESDPQHQPRSLDSQQLPSYQSKSLDPLPPPSPQPCRSPPERSGSALSCTRSHSECHYHGADPHQQQHHPPPPAGSGPHARCSKPTGPPLTKVDSGYASNLNIHLPGQSAQPWGAGAPPAQAPGCLPAAYSSEELRYGPLSGFMPPGVQSLLAAAAGRSVYGSQLAHQYPGHEGLPHPGSYHVVYGPGGGGALQGPAGPAAGYHPLHRPQHGQAELGLIGKAFGQPGPEPWSTAGGLDELRGQVVVPGEIRFPHACCVGIASQASLSLFNPSERWQQVSVSLGSLAIDGVKVDSLPYQWLLVKNKTIMGPKSTEEQKVLLIPPQAGVYQCALSVSSWPASAEPELAARHDVFAKRVALVAVAENPALEIEAGKSGSLDFGDVSEGVSKSLPLKLLNRTHATVPIRLVISANASAWRCFTFSKNPAVSTAEESLQAGHMTPTPSPSVLNHVMHASYGESPESFLLWVHFRAPQKYSGVPGELGPAEEYAARVDVELDSPGPSQVIQSVPLQARGGTARVHAPKDLQTISLCAPPGRASHQDLPLKNAGNIDVQLRLKSKDAEDCFSVSPDELHLGVGEEKRVVVSFAAHGSRKCRESLLTILVLPSGPQYEVTLRGDVTPENQAQGKPVAAAAAEAPPILSNKQFVSWGGVTLGRAVQQKLVLRNNSADGTQQLRLLIRGQDQDCFQLQSMFSAEQRVTRHGELSIRAREDVAVHLLFAPSRVACMVAKLEIKQSGVRPSQPGVKFTIPLSGYGGTSNIIVEDQRKAADGYEATLGGVALGRISKVCVSVRNTGSRAAFVKAAAYADLQARLPMAPAVLSLSPSQFVLKERTQEVVTVLLKSTEREASLCRSARALLATVCLFCGDEVSRQQYRRLLQSTPEAGRKVLSDNSLLKNIHFNETFLGEDQITESVDLPQRPNEAQVFYGNMSKVVLSLLGTTERSDPGGQAERADPVQHAAETHSVLANSSVSLDVLPVKGPQGPALRAAQPALKAEARTDEEKADVRQGSWSVHPDQLVLSAPTLNGPASTRHVRLQNHAAQELSFELSWPAHCLTITPQHGVIEPQSHLQILISPNPSLASRTSTLPWGGQVYVQCGGTQKSIKVQIHRGLELDVSPAPAERSLAALAPQAATPQLPLVRPHSQAPRPQDSQPAAQASQAQTAPLSPPALVELGSRTVVFPATPSGESSESILEVENGEQEVRWYLSSFAPPYVKGVDHSGDVFRATYSAFMCSRVSGTLGAREKMQVPITFLPRDRGDYAQFWDLECHPVSDPQQKTRARFQLCGTGVRSGPVEAPQEADRSLVRTEVSVKTRKRSEAAAAVKTGPEEAAVRRGVYSPQDLYTFPPTRLGESSTLKVNIRNNSADTHELNFVSPREPFHIKHSRYSLRSQHYLKLPVQFKPSSAAGAHSDLLLVQSETSGGLVIRLSGEALP